jgi:hypothetical protein
MNERELVARIAYPTSSVSWMMTTEMAFGRMCLASRRGPEIPMLSAAATKSR